jgi:uncharacterized membrane protein YesL
VFVVFGTLPVHTEPRLLRSEGERDRDIIAITSFTLLYRLHYQRMKLVFHLLVILSLPVRVDDGGCTVSHVVGGRFPEETEEWQ